MAYIGLAYPTIAKLDPATDTYSDGFRMGKAVSVNINTNYNEANLPGDNVIAETVKEFRDGTIDLGITTIPIEAYETVFGHTVTPGEDGTLIVDKTDDVPNYVGVGLVKEELVDGKKSYIAMWIKKVLFTESGENATTKGETISFQTPTITGTVLALADKTWRARKVFDNEADAIDYINEQANIAVKCTTPTASLASGEYTAAQATGVTLTAGDGETIYYTINGITPSATTGTEYVEGIDIIASCALKAVAVKDGQNDSDIAVYEYIISE